MKRSLVPLMAFMTVVVAVVLWLYVQFLVPRMHAPLVGKIALPVAFVFFMLLPFVGAWRGNTLDTRTESQQQWAHGSNYWVLLAFLVIAPFSLPAAAVVATLIIIGAQCYVYLWRSKPQP